MSTDLVLLTPKVARGTRKDITVRERAKLIALRKEGVSFKDIAQELGRSVSVLQTYASKHGIKGPPRERRALDKKQQAEAIRLWNTGAQKKAIAKHFGVSVTAINNIPGMPMKNMKGKTIDKKLGMPVVLTPSVKRRLDVMSREIGVARIRIVREAVKRELDRLERERDLGANRRAYGV